MIIMIIIVVLVIIVFSYFTNSNHLLSVFVAFSLWMNDVHVL